MDLAMPSRHPPPYPGVTVSRVLNLANNEFEAVPKCVPGLRSLGRLNLSGNPLRSLSGDLFKPMANLKVGPWVAGGGCLVYGCMSRAF